MRNPLNAAKLQLELLERRLRRGGIEPRLIETTQHAHDEIERLTQLLNEFLAFARPPQLGAADHDLVGIARQVLEAERPLAEAAGVDLRLEPASPTVVAELDPGKLHQILQNLVRNGIEAVVGRAAPVVAVALATGPGGDAVVAVRDNGVGIADEVVPHIYEPFYSTKEGGTGMGMAIVHSLVTAHGGEIDVASGPRGTTFTLTLRRHLR